MTATNADADAAELFADLADRLVDWGRAGEVGRRGALTHRARILLAFLAGKFVSVTYVEEDGGVAAASGLATS